VSLPGHDLPFPEYVHDREILSQILD